MVHMHGQVQHVIGSPPVNQRDAVNRLVIKSDTRQ